MERAQCPNFQLRRHSHARRRANPRGSPQPHHKSNWFQFAQPSARYIVHWVLQWQLSWHLKENVTSNSVEQRGRRMFRKTHTVLYKTLIFLSVLSVNTPNTHAHPRWSNTAFTASDRKMLAPRGNCKQEFCEEKVVWQIVAIVAIHQLQHFQGCSIAFAHQPAVGL